MDLLREQLGWGIFHRTVNRTGTSLSADTEDFAQKMQRKDELLPGQCQMGKAHRTPPGQQDPAAAGGWSPAKHLCLGIRIYKH